MEATQATGFSIASAFAPHHPEWARSLYHIHFSNNSSLSPATEEHAGRAPRWPKAAKGPRPARKIRLATKRGIRRCGPLTFALERVRTEHYGHPHSSRHRHHITRSRVSPCLKPCRSLRSCYRCRSFLRIHYYTQRLEKRNCKLCTRIRCLWQDAPPVITPSSRR